MPLGDARLRLAAAILGLVSLGLLLSLLPRTSFVARSAGDIVDAVGPVWPEQSVEQVLDDGLGVVSEVRIWGAAGAGRDEEAPVVAALLRGPDRELVRQDRVGIKASHLLQPYVLEFAPYAPVPGEVLTLQLWVTDERRNHAIFGTTEAGGEGGGPTLNLNATDQGPLAYDVIWRGDGWRAALEGSWLDLMRLAGGIAAAVVAVLFGSPGARRLSRVLGRFQAAVVVGGATADKLRLATAWLRVQRPPLEPTAGRRSFYVFPWLIPAFAILHFLATNLILLRAYEAILPSVVIMAGVTGVFVALRIVLNGAAPAALFTGMLGIIFFSYGHIYITDVEQPDWRFLLGIGVPLIVGAAMLLRGRIDFAHRIGRILNFASIVLIVFPILQLLQVLVSTQTQQREDNSILANSADIKGQINDGLSAIPSHDLRDVYVIQLDGYPRSGSPESFDNSAFVQELETRGFYVDPHARSNYTCSVWSITSSLNMSYIQHPRPCNESLVDTYRIYDAALDHALGRMLTRMGYKYTHVSSGWQMTATSRNAEEIVDFTPQGRIISGYVDYDQRSQYRYHWQRAFSLSNRFMSKFLKTTLAKAIYRPDAFQAVDHYVDTWTDPRRVLDWMDYMNELGADASPQFVFAHLVKPHSPYSFDQFGEIAPGGAWSDEHDPTVKSALYGQIIWLNSRLLEIIDGILARSSMKPIIVIMSDHGIENCSFDPMCHDILAAYLLPDNGDNPMYEGITSVNVFRAMLSQYFGVSLELLDDRIFLSPG